MRRVTNWHRSRTNWRSSWQRSTCVAPLWLLHGLRGGWLRPVLIACVQRKENTCRASITALKDEMLSVKQQVLRR